MVSEWYLSCCGCSLLIASRGLSKNKCCADEEEEEQVGLVPASADDAPREFKLEDGKKAAGRPTGRVVGIIKRNWRQ